jgi:hypothetical protein
MALNALGTRSSILGKTHFSLTSYSFDILGS